MDDAERDLLRAIFHSLYKSGLLTERTYSAALGLAASATDIPELIRLPGEGKEAGGGHTACTP